MAAINMGDQWRLSWQRLFLSAVGVLMFGCEVDKPKWHVEQPSDDTLEWQGTNVQQAKTSVVIKTHAWHIPAFSEGDNKGAPFRSWDFRVKAEFPFASYADSVDEYGVAKYVSEPPPFREFKYILCDKAGNQLAIQSKLFSKNARILKGTTKTFVQKYAGMIKVSLVDRVAYGRLIIVTHVPPKLD